MHFVVFSSSLNVNNFLRNIFLQDNGRVTTDMFLTFFTRKLVFVRQAVVAITERTSVVRRKTNIGNLGIKFTDALFTSPTLCIRSNAGTLVWRSMSVLSILALICDFNFLRAKYISF